MYGNDYSYVPALFAGLMTTAGAGGLIVSLIPASRIRIPAFQAWLSVPVLLSVGLGVIVALWADNIEPHTSILAAVFFSVIFVPPWLIVACSVFIISRYLQGVAADRNAK